MDDMHSAQPAGRYRIFKGCTRPALFCGVPLMPFLLVTGVTLLMAMWMLFLSRWRFFHLLAYAALILGMLYVPLVIYMRAMTAKDDQRLRQVVLRYSMRHRHANKHLWTAVSYSPLRLKKRGQDGFKLSQVLRRKKEPN